MAQRYTDEDLDLLEALIRAVVDKDATEGLPSTRYGQESKDTADQRLSFVREMLKND